MARNRDTVTFNVDLVLTDKQVTEICKQTDEPGLTDGQKVAGFALGCLREIAAGGMLIDADEMLHMRQSSGLEITCAADIMPHLTEASGMEEGKYVVKLLIDPEYYSACEDTAQIRGWDVQQLVQEAVDNAMIQGWFEAIPESRISFVVMGTKDKQALEELLGGNFNNGQELLTLVRNQIGAGTPMDDHLFEAEAV